jgi:DeoR family suf operon transcriptional repressor
MKSTRDRILHSLLTHRQSTVHDLAQSVGINAISVRHHLTSLQAEGLVGAEEERHGVGRPRLIYTLTEKGIERFPTRYLRLMNRILDHLKATLPQQSIRNLFSEIANQMVTDLSDKGKFLNLEGKLSLLKETLVEEGFTLDWEKQGDKYIIREVNCPYFHISRTHPEVCLLDQTFISTVLSIPAEKVKCILNGDAGCAYTIQTKEVM